MNKVRSDLSGPPMLLIVDDDPVVVVTADDRVETAVRCMKSGAFDFMDKPLSPARIMSLLAHAKENIKLRALLEPMNPALRSPAFSRIVTRSPLMLGLFQTIERLGPSPLPVLVYGESGTDKELIGRALSSVLKAERFSWTR